jgi:hypothetical protein
MIYHGQGPSLPRSPQAWSCQSLYSEVLSPFNNLSKRPDYDDNISEHRVKVPSLTQRTSHAQ